MELLVISQIANPVEATTEVVKLISDYGIMVVTAAFFIIMSLINLWSTNKRYDKILKQNDDRYEKLFQKYIEGTSAVELIDKVTTLVTAVNDLVGPVEKLLSTTTELYKEECTYQQIVRTLKSESRLAKYNLLSEVEGLVSMHLEDPDLDDRVRKIVINNRNDLKNNLNLYKYKGIVIGNFIKDAWDDKMVILIKNYLTEIITMSDLSKDLDMHFSEAYNYFISKLREIS